MDQQAKWFPEGSLQVLPDNEADRGAFEISRGSSSPATPCFFTCSRCTRQAGATRRRRAFSVRFLGDDATHAPRAWKTSPEFPGLVDELPAGAPLEHPLFPVVCRERRGRRALRAALDEFTAARNALAKKLGSEEIGSSRSRRSPPGP